MRINTDKIRQCLKNFDFKTLFIEELGWDHHASLLEVMVDDKNYHLKSVAQKQDFVVFMLKMDSTSGVESILLSFPDYATRRKIERQVARSAHEHLIIYVDSQSSSQIWQWVKKEPGRPTACREHHYHISQPGDALIQKLQTIAFSLEEEEELLTIIDVAGRVRAAFDVDKVTKRFYDRFKKEHDEFMKFLTGIPDAEMQNWYISVMNNRLMFIYFIQKKNFLNGDPDYLYHKLKQFKQAKPNRYYKDFLCPLFFEGFAKRDAERSSETSRLLGKVPYLNGGLFLKHQIEELHGDQIQIADKAFEKLFSFFDQYHWHLDERPLRKDDEINPDVLGYIFEKYINQKQMGAYYTKEDITEYITKNTVIPNLFDQAQKKYKKAFEGENSDRGRTQSIWRLLQEEPDRYIYDAVKKGVDLQLPAEIAVGLNDVSQRTEWNKPALPEYALSTEIWREVVARRQRYEEVHQKLANGEVQSINDFITYNLDIRKFAHEVIESCDDPELLRAFWPAIQDISVLDPTCGSGAFLFAALNILEPLYEACLNRMEIFLSELEPAGVQSLYGLHERPIKVSHSSYPSKYSDFRKILTQVEKHPNQRYFILKSIILNNLYGVDIMDEAVEICKLRLFLKLVAQIDKLEEIEPLPDIDFNIRAGNTLVGYATYQEVEKAITSKLDFENSLQRIEQKAQDVDRLFQLFRQQQTELGGEVTFCDKQNLRKRLNELEQELNHYLAGEYGIDLNNQKAYQKWLESHKPFHWFIEFYSIQKQGGFSVIIGNPPYINSINVRKNYFIKNYNTELCPDIYAWVLERVSQLLNSECRSGMIVPLSLGFSKDFGTCRNIIFDNYGNNWFSSYGRIPSALFSFDVRVRNTIHIGHKTKKEGQNFTTLLHRWFEIERPHLFKTIEYASFQNNIWHNRVPKFSNSSIGRAFESSFNQKNLPIGAVFSSRPTRHSLNYKKTAYNWLIFSPKLPPCFDQYGKASEHTQFDTIYFNDEKNKEVSYLLLNGKLAFLYWAIVGDDFHVAKWMFENIPIDLFKLPENIQEKLILISHQLKLSMEQAITFKVNAGKKIGNYNLAKCRDVTDLSDKIFADFLGISNIWEEVEIFYNKIVKTSFDETE